MTPYAYVMLILFIIIPNFEDYLTIFDNINDEKISRNESNDILNTLPRFCLKKKG